MELIAVTNRSLCKDKQDFLARVRCLSEHLRPGDRLLLREKDLPLEKYSALAEEVRSVWKGAPEQILLHTHFDGKALGGFSHVHLPLPLLRQERPENKTVSSSVHSVEEALEAQALGAKFLIAGHIFPTDCKKGLAPRGTEFLKAVVDSVRIPVYAIGGITPERLSLLEDCGAAGFCVMSGFMTCEDLPAALNSFGR